MSQQRRITESTSESDVSSMNFAGTELTLALPGSEGRSPPAVTGGNKNGSKRGFMDTIDLNLRSKQRGATCTHVNDTSESGVSATGKCPASKAQVIGWPPVRSYRKKALDERRSKLAKVAVDGAAYLRKVDLSFYDSYEDLLRALQEMFASTFTILGNNYMEDQTKITASGVMAVGYVATYEDKDNDWMLVGDVPWKMFTESCKRIRLMKSSDAMGLAASRISSANCRSSD